MRKDIPLIGVDLSPVIKFEWRVKPASALKAMIVMAALPLAVVGGKQGYEALDQAFMQPRRVEYAGFAPAFGQEEPKEWQRITDWNRKK